MITHGGVYDPDLHFLEGVGRWQTCHGVEGTEKDGVLSLSSAIRMAQATKACAGGPWGTHSTWDIALDSSALAQHPARGG